MSADLQLFEEETPVSAQTLEIAPDDNGIDEQSMPTIAAASPVLAVQLEPEPMPLMQILPADFRLPVLTRFVPDLAIKKALDDALVYLQAIEIEGQGREGITRADAGLSEVNARIAAAEAHFEDPASIAFELHRHVTGTRASWVTDAKAVVKSKGNAVWKEGERLKAEAAKEQRRIQDEANAKARQEAEEAAALAKKNQAPPAVVQKLEERAKTATAPPVPAPVSAAPLMTDNSVVTTYKAKFVSTPDDAEGVHPDITKLSPAELGDIKVLLKAIVDGRTDLLSLLSIEWGKLDKLAVSQEGTFSVPGFVAFKTGGTRKKATRGRK